MGKAGKAAAWNESLQGIHRDHSKIDAANSEPTIASIESTANVANQGKEESLAVFVGGFPFSISEENLRKDFAECGEIAKFVIPKDAEGKRRGIAFVTFKTEAGVEAACKY